MIEKENVKKYWDERVANEKELTVGPRGYDLEAQNSLYYKRMDFLKDKINFHEPMGELGCGTGRWSEYFMGYLGFDICRGIIELAKTNYDLSADDFIMVNSIDFKDSFYFLRRFNPIRANIMFFTVLQHNSDETVDAIFRNMSEIYIPNILYLYENKEDNGAHVKARSQLDYIKMLGKYFKVNVLRVEDHRLDALHGFLSVKLEKK